jgi:GT2 family glycosyltransferase
MSQTQVQAQPLASRIGAVVIGRNEGERLKAGLTRVLQDLIHVVYVDSGSSDGSVQWARKRGVEVVELDMLQPFTAARARNAGFARLLKIAPLLHHVQLIDGDCELAEGWLQTADAFLTEHSEIVAVCGRRRERHPQASIYNLLCDIEWNTPIGTATACGGDVLMRVAALQGVGGYREDLIAGEEPELCVRLRRQGGTIWRLDAEMTWHDAAMQHFSQWWKRSMRAGYAFAQGAALHGSSPQRHWVKESRSAWIWGLLPVVILLYAAVWGGILSLLLLAIYPVQMVRLYLKSAHTPSLEALHNTPLARAARAFFLVLGKFAEVCGQSKFTFHRLTGRAGRLIEYK